MVWHLPRVIYPAISTIRLPLDFGTFGRMVVLSLSGRLTPYTLGFLETHFKFLESCACTRKTR